MVKTALLSSTYFGPVQWYQKLVRYDRCVFERYDHFVKQTYRNRCVIATTQGTQTLTVPVSVPPASPSAKPAELGSKENKMIDGKNDEMGAFRASKGKTLMRDILISDHANWRHLHWNALCSAYGESPFFEFYADDIRPFFERRWTSLFEFNLDITLKMCELLDFEPHITLTDDYIKPQTIDVERRNVSPLKAGEGAVLKGKLPEVGAQLGSGAQLGAEEHQSAGGVPQVLLPDGTLADDYREVIRPKHPLPDPLFTPEPYYQVYRQKHGFLPNLSILDLLFNEGNESILHLINS